MNKTGVCKLQSGGKNRDLTKDGQVLHSTTCKYETLCSRRDFTDVMEGLEMGDDLGLLQGGGWGRCHYRILTRERGKPKVT